jgi:biotin operon repressor
MPMIKCKKCGTVIGLPKLHSFMFEVFLLSLEKNDWNRTQTARDLGVSVRTVRHWVRLLRFLGYEVEDSKAKGGRRAKDFPLA